MSRSIMTIATFTDRWSSPQFFPFPLCSFVLRHLNLG